MEKRMTVDVEYLRTVQTAWSGLWGCIEDEFTKQYDHFIRVYACTSKDVEELVRKYRAPQYRVRIIGVE